MVGVHGECHTQWSQQVRAVGLKWVTYRIVVTSDSSFCELCHHILFCLEAFFQTCSHRRHVLKGYDNVIRHN